MAKKQESNLGSAECRLDIPIRAPQRRVWKALVAETSRWWPNEFYATSAREFVIEPRLGGRVYENAGGGHGLMWYSVIGIEPPSSLTLAGYLVPPFAGPGTSFLRLNLAKIDASETLLEVTDHCFGQVAGCEPAEGWQTVFESGLKRYVEGAKRKRK